jgi:hypothetical protein
MSMPSFDWMKSTPATEVLRIESEPPGADARTSQGQTCRTPCELNVPVSGDLAVTIAMAGYQPQTLPLRQEGRGVEQRLEPNPVYVELQPAVPVRPAKPAAPAAPKKKASAAAAPPPAPKPQTQAAAPAPSTLYPLSSQGYPWPPAPQ